METKVVQVSDMQQVKREWNWIRAGLLKIMKRQDCDWIPEDVYLWIMSGKWKLLVMSDGSAFAVVEEGASRFKNEPFLYVHAIDAEGVGGNQTFHNAVLDYARDNGYAQLRCESARDISKLGGWEVDTTTFKWRV